MNLTKLVTTVTLGVSLASVASAGALSALAAKQAKPVAAPVARAVVAARAAGDTEYVVYQSQLETATNTLDQIITDRGYITSAALSGYATENYVDTAVNTLAGAVVTATNDLYTAIDSAKADKAKTLAGYGITNAYTKTEVDSSLETLAGAMDEDLTAATNAVMTVVNGKADAATTLAGYGITDAKIEGGVITLGSETITPLTSFTETDPNVPSWAKAESKPSYTFSEIGSTPTTLAGYGITDAGIANGVITLGSATITPVTTETDPTIYDWAKAATKPSYNFSEIGSTPTTLAGYGVTDAYTSTETDTAITGATNALATAIATTLNDYALANDLTTHTGNSDIHVTTSDKTAWSAKYDKPADGIPSTDMSAAVQASLGLADSALQSHQDISGKADKSELTIDTSTTGRAVINLKGTGSTATKVTAITDFVLYGDTTGTAYRLGVDANGQLYLVELGE